MKQLLIYHHSYLVLSYIDISILFSRNTFILAAKQALHIVYNKLRSSLSNRPLALSGVFGIQGHLEKIGACWNMQEHATVKNHYLKMRLFL